MNHQTSFSPEKRKFSIILIGVLLAIPIFGLITVSAFFPAVSAESSLRAEGTPSFLPVIMYLPTPTPSPTPTSLPEPQFVTNIPLPEAQCPNNVVANLQTNYVYVTNNGSANISLLKETAFLKNVYIGRWPTLIASDPASDRVFITNLLGETGLNVFHGPDLTEQHTKRYKPFTPLYNPVNKYLYITDYDSNIRVYDASTTPITFITDLNRSKGVTGLIKAIDMDPKTGIVYAASWGTAVQGIPQENLYVIKDAELIATVNTHTWGTDNLLFADGHLYLAASQLAARPSNVANYNITVINPYPPYQLLAGISTARAAEDLAFDPREKLVYITNQLDGKVTVMRGTDVVSVLSVDNDPWHVAVNPNTGYAFVTHPSLDKVSVLKNGQFVKTIPTQGIYSFTVGINPNTNYVYIGNRGHSIQGPDYLPHCSDSSITILR